MLGLSTASIIEKIGARKPDWARSTSTNEFIRAFNILRKLGSKDDMAALLSVTEALWTQPERDEIRRTLLQQLHGDDELLWYISARLHAHGLADAKLFFDAVSDPEKDPELLSVGVGIFNEILRTYDELRGKDADEDDTE